LSHCKQDTDKMDDTSPSGQPVYNRRQSGGRTPSSALRDLAIGTDKPRFRIIWSNGSSRCYFFDSLKNEATWQVPDEFNPRIHELSTESRVNYVTAEINTHAMHKATTSHIPVNWERMAAIFHKLKHEVADEDKCVLDVLIGQIMIDRKGPVEGIEMPLDTKKL